MISLETLDNCPVCNSGKFTIYIETKDYSVSGEPFNIVSCNNCHFRFTNPRPRPEDLGKYYESADYISHTNQGNTLVNGMYKKARSFTIRWKLKLIQANQPKGTLLDFGCGTGQFLEYCQKHGWKINGVEPGEGARAIANEATDGKVVEALSQLESSSYNVITLWHVLEHIAHLNETFEQLKQHLKSDGEMLIAVPNSEAKDAQEFGAHWAAYDVPRHLYHFTPETMAKFMAKHGMTIVETIPMKLDAYYVSLLSNKHKNGSQKLLKSFLNGLQSNSYANKSGNFSSLIYRVRKIDV
jgi:2-polyprenyl-3-methyl-5-hydroxy-6-metoxy-1,4-benzoquinol methylase